MVRQKANFGELIKLGLSSIEGLKHGGGQTFIFDFETSSYSNYALRGVCAFGAGLLGILVECNIRFDGASINDEVSGLGDFFMGGFGTLQLRNDIDAPIMASDENRRRLREMIHVNDSYGGAGDGIADRYAMARVIAEDIEIEYDLRAVAQIILKDAVYDALDQAIFEFPRAGCGYEEDEEEYEDDDVPDEVESEDGDFGDDDFDFDGHDADAAPPLTEEEWEGLFGDIEEEDIEFVPDEEPIPA